MPITGFSGFVFTSATGARFRFTPTSARSAPIDAATRSVRPTSSTAPSAALPGYELPVATSSRVTSPPSSSIPTSSSPSARSDDVSERSCAALSTFQPKSTTPPRPSASLRRIQSGATGPSKPGRMHASASRSRLIP